MATDRVRVRLSSLDSDTLAEATVLELDGREALNELFEMSLLISLGMDRLLDPDELITSRITLHFEARDVSLEASAGSERWREVRRVHGIVEQCEDMLHFTDRNAYRLRVVPRFHWATLVETLDIYMDLSVTGILRHKLGRLGLVEGWDFELRVDEARYETREFVVQYRETDHAFLSRLIEHVGIAYCFEHDEERDKIVFTDENAAFMEIPGEPGVDEGSVRFSQGEEIGIHRLSSRTRMVPKSFKQRDYNYRTPQTELVGDSEMSDGAGGGIIEYGGHFKNEAEAKRLAEVRKEEARAQRYGFRGAATDPRLCPGVRLTLEGHPRGAELRLVTTEVHHRARQPEWAGLSGEGAPGYECELRALSLNTTFRPRRLTPRPRITGTVTGVVEGEEDSEYAQIDDQGRYLVKFIFDSTGPGERKASRPLRMMQPHAGPGYGMHFPLRKGTEVLIVFLDGDPDRPIIAGTVPNPQTESPVLSGNHKKNIIRTGGGNEIDIDDDDGSKRIKLTTPHASTILQLGAPNDAEDGGRLATVRNFTTTATGTTGFISGAQASWSVFNDTWGNHITNFAGAVTPMQHLQFGIDMTKAQIALVKSAVDSVIAAQSLDIMVQEEELKKKKEEQAKQQAELDATDPATVGSAAILADVARLPDPPAHHDATNASCGAKDFLAKLAAVKGGANSYAALETTHSGKQADYEREKAELAAAKAATATAKANLKAKSKAEAEAFKELETAKRRFESYGASSTEAPTGGEVAAAQAAYDAAQAATTAAMTHYGTKKNDEKTAQGELAAALKALKDSSKALKTSRSNFEDALTELRNSVKTTDPATLRCTCHDATSRSCPGAGADCTCSTSLGITRASVADPLVDLEDTVEDTAKHEQGQDEVLHRERDIASREDDLASAKEKKDDTQAVSDALAAGTEMIDLVLPLWSFFTTIVATGMQGYARNVADAMLQEARRQQVGNLPRVPLKQIKWSINPLTAFAKNVDVALLPGEQRLNDQMNFALRLDVDKWKEAFDATEMKPGGGGGILGMFKGVSATEKLKAAAWLSAVVLVPIVGPMLAARVARSNAYGESRNIQGSEQHAILFGKESAFVSGHNSTIISSSKSVVVTADEQAVMNSRGHTEIAGVEKALVSSSNLVDVGSRGSVEITTRGKSGTVDPRSIKNSSLNRWGADFEDEPIQGRVSLYRDVVIIGAYKHTGYTAAEFKNPFAEKHRAGATFCGYYNKQVQVRGAGVGGPWSDSVLMAQETKSNAQYIRLAANHASPDDSTIRMVTTGHFSVWSKKDARIEVKEELVIQIDKSGPSITMDKDKIELKMAASGPSITMTKNDIIIECKQDKISLKQGITLDSAKKAQVAVKAGVFSKDPSGGSLKVVQGKIIGQGTMIGWG